MMNNKTVYQALATLGPLGYFSAPGTWGAFVALPVVFLCGASPWYPVLVATVAVIAFFCIHKSLPTFNTKDPSHIVLDEFVGCLLVFVGSAPTLVHLFVGFLLFRLFDISKCCGSSWFETLPGARGILFDDCWAALLAHILLRVLVCYGVV